MMRPFRFLFLMFLVSFPIQFSVSQQPFYKYYTLNEGFPHAQVWKIFQDKNGMMWFATGGGLAVYDGAQYTFYGKEAGFVGNARNIFEDDNGLIWIPSDDGVSIFDGKRFSDFALPDHNNPSSLWDMLKDRTGRYWFPSRHCGIHVLDRGTFFSIPDSVTGSCREYFSCMMDSDGDLWFGCKDGVLWLRFQNGTYESDFRTISSSDAGPLGQINDIYQSPEGHILFCSVNGLIFFNKQNYIRDNGQIRDCITRLTPKEGLIHTYVNSAVMTLDSSYWIATDHGLSRYQKNGFSNHLIDEQLSANSLQCVIEDREGVIWIGTNGGGCIKIPYQDIINFTAKDGLPSNVVNAVTMDSMNNLYIATDNGVEIWDGKNLKPLGGNWHESGDAVWVVKTSPSGSLWIGTENHLFEYKNQKIIDHKSLYQAEDASVLDIEIDHNGHVWIGSHHGLTYYDGKGYQKFTLNDGLPGIQIWCVYEDRQHHIWLGSNNGLIRAIRNPSTGNVVFQSWNTAHGLPNNTVNVIRQDPGGIYWIGTDDGFARFDGNRFYNYKPKKLGLGDNVVPVLEIDSATQSLWIGSTMFGQFEIRDTVLVLKSVLNKTRGLNANEATTNNSLMFDQAGNMWIGTFGGLTHFIRNHPRLPSSNPRAVIQKMTSPEITWIKPHTFNPSPLEKMIKGNSVIFEFAGLSYINEKDNSFQYMLEEFDDEWSEFTRQTDVRYTNLRPGRYAFLLRMKNARGETGQFVDRFEFEVRTPLWMNPFILAGSTLLLLFGIYKTYKYRVHKKLDKIHRLNLELESKIRDRTSEISKQKEELEALFIQLKQTHTQLLQSEKMASLGQLVAGVAHEINNPTSILAGNVNYIDDYLKIIKGLIQQYESAGLSEEQNSAIRTYKDTNDYDFIVSDLDVLISSIKNAAERIRHIVLDLRNFSRLDEAELIEVLINDCIDTTVKLFMNQFKQILTIKKDFRASRKINCYVNQINQVLLNLLVNAAHAIEEKIQSQKSNGKILGEILISTADSSDGIIVKIRDNGCGIREENISKIFDPFFTTKPVGQGTGLGLSITYGIIEKHTGAIYCQSKVDEWTEFTIELPIKPRDDRY